MRDTHAEMLDEAAAVAGIEALPEVLKVLCDITGLGFSVIARLNDHVWTACAVHDRINFGVEPGMRVDANATFCNEVRKLRDAIVINQASTDPVYGSHPLPRRYGFESYLSVPIILANGDYFGNLCALDRQPTRVSDPRNQLMFHCFAKLIAQQIDSRATPRARQLPVLDKPMVDNLRALFTAMLAHTAPGEGNPEAVGDPALQQLAARAATQSQRLSSLVNDVLIYARGRLNGGIPGYIWKVDDLNARLKSVVAATLAAHPSRTIITNISVNQPVDCDPARIQQLASNLLNNALAHGAPAGPVSFIASTSDQDLEIAVWNEGNVISKQALRNVFSPAWRPESNRPAARLGLHLCAEIVRAHLGTIGVTSSVTEGTQFVARIPVARASRLH